MACKVQNVEYLWKRVNCLGNCCLTGNPQSLDTCSYADTVTHLPKWVTVSSYSELPVWVTLRELPKWVLFLTGNRERKSCSSVIK